MKRFTIKPKHPDNKGNHNVVVSVYDPDTKKTTYLGRGWTKTFPSGDKYIDVLLDDEYNGKPGYAIVEERNVEKEADREMDKLVGDGTDPERIAAEDIPF